LVHFGLKNASGESNFKCTFTGMKLFRCDFVMTLLEFVHYYQRQLTDYREFITIN